MKIPKIVPLEQRSPEWHAWRAGVDIDGPRITATDIPVIMGVSKFATPYELWLRKTGRTPPQPMNWAMRRGVYYEPIARSLVERIRGQSYLDCCVEHPDVSWAAASLDGLSPLYDELLEIKVPGEETHAMAVLGEVPPWYFGQVQWQLMCSPGVDRGLYASFVPPDDDVLRRDRGAEGQVVLVEVLPDLAFQEQARVAAEAFRACLIEDVPPCGEEFLSLAAAYDQLRMQNKGVEERLASIEARMKSYVNVVDRQIQGGGITIAQSVRKGTINLSEYLKSRGIDVDWQEAESYRGPASSSVSLHYRPGVAFPILRQALGLPPLAGMSPGDGAPDEAGSSQQAEGGSVIDHDEGLEAALLI